MASQAKYKGSESASFFLRTKDSIGLLGGSMQLLWQASRWLVFAAAVPGVILAVLPVFSMIAVGRAVDAAITREHFGRWLLLLIVALALGQLIQPVSSVIQAHLGNRFTRMVRAQMLRQINSWPGTARLEDPDTLDDLTKVSNRLNSTGPEMLNRLFQMITGLATIAFTIGLVTQVSPVLALLVLVSQLPPMVGQWRFADVTGSRMHVQAPKARRLGYLSELAVSMPEAKDLRLRDGFDFLDHRYREVYRECEGEIVEAERRSGGLLLAGQLFSGLILAATLVWLVHGVAASAISPGQAALTLSALVTVASSMRMIAFDLGFLPLALQTIPILQRLITAGPDLAIKPGGRTEIPDRPVEISFDQVVFTYPGASEPTLAGVSFTVPAGQSLALVGHNGSGKTTIVKLLLRFYDVDSGRVLVDGTDVREWDVAALRRTAGSLFQDFARWELTVGENIGLGDVEAVGARVQVEAAASAGNAATFISELPDRYDTRLGTDLGDRPLSGGQWQRLALARATMSQARLLVLDEPTAELDPRAESEVFDRYAALAAERTIILVSHRFSTVRQADRIVVLERGLVREWGTHPELMARQGEYARQYRLQASQYLEVDDVAQASAPEGQR